MFLLYQLLIRVFDAVVLRVMKGHLKQKDAMKVLVKRAVENGTARHLPKLEEPNPPRPRQLSSALTPISEKLSEVKAKIASDTPVLEPVIQHLSEDQLKTLAEIFQGKGSTEDKLYSASFVLLSDDLNLINQSMEHLKFLKCEIVKTFVDAYANEFNAVKGGSLSFFNNDAIQTMLRDAQQYHWMLRRDDYKALQLLLSIVTWCVFCCWLSLYNLDIFSK